MISDSYKAQLSQLHREKEDFGTSAGMYVPIIRGIIKRYKPESLLDYGCGKAVLKDELGILGGYVGYDPSIEEYSAIPEPADLVCNLDVLEHVESEYVIPVLDDLKRVTKKVGFFAIHTGPALNHLPDGRNCHITQKPCECWLSLIIERFDIRALEKGQHGFWIIVEPKSS